MDTYCMEIQNQDQEYTLGDTWSPAEDNTTTGSRTNINGSCNNNISGSCGDLAGSRRQLAGSKLRIDGSHEHIAGNNHDIPVDNCHRSNTVEFIPETENIISGSSGKMAGSEGRVTFTLAATSFVTVFGSSFPHGWNIGVLNIPADHIQTYINDSYRERFDDIPSDTVLSVLWAATSAIYLVGGTIGALMAGWMAERFGRKCSLLLLNPISILASLLFLLCHVVTSVEMLLVGRLLVGIGCGASAGIVPIYLTEVAPLRLRGSMGVLHQFAFTIGMLAAYILSLRQVLGTSTLWPLLLACTCVPSFTSLALLPCCPSSPRYQLAVKRDKLQASQALQRLRHQENVTEELAGIQQEINAQTSSEVWSVWKLVSDRALRLAVVVACVVGASQNTSGINVAFFYSTTIFKSSGIQEDYIQYAVVGQGLVNVLSTAISIPLMERCGRRILMLFSLITMILSSVVMTVSLTLQPQHSEMAYLSLACMVTFITGFALGLGPIPTFLAAELFQQGPRPPAMAVSMTCNMLAGFLVTVVFPPMELVLHSYSFLPFTIISLIILVFLWKTLPETKGKTYEQIQQAFQKDQKENPYRVPVNDVT